MNRETEAHADKSSHRAAQRHGREETMGDEPTTKNKWDASWERVVVGVAAAAGAGLLAAMSLGVGPAAIAGAAGYFAYRGLSEKRGERRSERGETGAEIKH